METNPDIPQVPPVTPPPAPLPPHRFPWAIVIVLLVFGMVSAFVVGYQWNNLTNSAPVQDTTMVPSPTNGAVAIPTQDSSTQASFLDDRLSGLAFTYDATVWSKPVATDPLTWRMGENARGALIFIHTLPFGRGGGVKVLADNDLKDLGNDFYRITLSQDAIPVYQYGLRKVTNTLNNTPAINLKIYAIDGGKENAIDLCNQQSLPDYEGMKVYSDADCSLLKSGSGVAELQDPSFVWSLRFPRVRPLGTFNSDWENDAYVKTLDTSRIITQVRYEGSLVEEADKVVKQLIRVK